MSTSSIPPSSNSRSTKNDDAHRKESEPSGDPKPFKKPDQKKQNPQSGQEGQSQLETTLTVEGSKTEGTQGITKTTVMQPMTPLSKIHAVILNAVSSMSVDTKGTTIQMNLKAGSNLPSAFQGGSLTISTQEGMTTIKFDNVKVDVATNLLQSNPEATQALANQLAARGIQNAQMQVGDHILPLPKAEATPLSPIDVHAGAQQEYYQRDGGGNGQGGRGQQESEGQEPE